MSLEVLTIKHETTRAAVYDGTVTALFNPNKLTYERAPTWTTINPAALATSGLRGTMQFQSIPPATLALDLFFDTYDPVSSSSSLIGAVTSAVSSIAQTPVTPTSVLTYTSLVEGLANVMPELHRPPVCQLYWGSSSALFTGVITRLNTTLELFFADGTPLRATMSCTFTDTTFADELHSPDVAKSYVVEPRDTLIMIAQNLYGDASQWRLIAQANGIDNPRVLTPGQVLAIPAIS